MGVTGMVLAAAAGAACWLGLSGTARTVGVAVAAVWLLAGVAMLPLAQRYPSLSAGGRHTATLVAASVGLLPVGVLFLAVLVVGPNLPLGIGGGGRRREDRAGSG